MNSTRELLLGYLLGSLQTDEKNAVELELESNPELREQMALLAASLAPLGFPHRDDPLDLDGPPQGLAERAIDFIEETEQALAIRSKTVRLSPVSANENSSSQRQLSWADVLVAACVLLAVSAMLFPAIASSRRAAQIAACQNNLRELGLALQQYGDQNGGGRIPAVPVRGNRSVAGIYSAILKDAALLPRDSVVLCPSAKPSTSNSTLVSTPDSMTNTTSPAFVIPSLAEIDKAVGDTLVKIQRSLGGDYAFSLGYVERSKHRSASMPGHAYYAVMSDAPAMKLEKPRSHTGHHGARGQNMLYADNRVKYVVDLDEDFQDDPYHNRSGMIAAGEDQEDMVLGVSLSRPMPMLFQTDHFEDSN